MENSIVDALGLGFGLGFGLDLCPPRSVSPRMTQILVVEDEYVIAANLQENLETLGYDVLDIASSGLEAVEKALEFSPDLVLMDIRLQGEMNGIQAAEHIWEQQQIPTIYVTGHSDRSTVQQALLTSPFGYILKPVKGQELYVAIETALNRYEREQLLTTVLRTMGDGVIITNTLGRILFLNQAAEHLTGWQHNEAKGRDLAEVFRLIYQDTFFPINNMAMIAVQQDDVVLCNDRTLLITKSETTLPISSSMTSLKNQRGLITGVVLLFRDNTQRRLQDEHNLAMERAQTFHQQYEELQHLSQLKADFWAMLSNELKAPLATIKSAIHTLEKAFEQPETANANVLAKVDQLTTCIDNLQSRYDEELSVANTVSELQQLEAEPRPATWTPIQLDELVLQTASGFQEQAHTKNQHLQVFISPNLPLLISDQEMLSRVITELLTNACNCTPPLGTITISVEVERKFELAKMQAQGNKPVGATDSQIIQLRVCNSGAEIPAEQLGHLFDKFYQIPTGDREPQRGTGIGLALVKKLIECLKGAITAHSGPEETCFIVDLPMLPPA